MFPLELLAVEAAFLTAAHVVGGPPWTVVAALGFAVLGLGGRPRGRGWRDSLWLMLPSLGWLVAFWATGRRELFFPFTMYVACHAALSRSHRGIAAAGVAGGLVVATFLTIRILQAATPRVLAVEALVAGAILVAGCVAIARRDRSLLGDGLILNGAAAAACVALAL